MITTINHQIKQGFYKKGEISLSSLKEGFDALTTIYNYEQDWKRKKAKDKAEEVSALMNEGNSISAAFNISHVYNNEDLMFTAYFMEELRQQLKQ